MWLAAGPSVPISPPLLQLPGKTYTTFSASPPSVDNDHPSNSSMDGYRIPAQGTLEYCALEHMKTGDDVKALDQVGQGRRQSLRLSGAVSIVGRAN